MKITAIKTALLAANFEWLFIRIETDEGLVGLGEAHWGYGVREAIHRYAPRLIGKDPRQVEPLWHELFGVVSGAAWQGATICAINGIEVALWDLLGKSLGQPVWQLLGGAYRDEVRILADLHAGAAYQIGDGTKVALYNPADAYKPEAYAARARTAVSRGYDAIKFDIDIPTLKPIDPHNHALTPDQLDQITAIVAAVREAVGRGVDLAIDCHWHYSTTDAIRVAQALEPFDLLWLEDPVRPENIDAMLEVTRATRTPICTGENLYLAQGFRELLARRACRIIEPDFPRSGGIGEMRRIAQLAELEYIPFAPHNVGGPLATTAAAHVCATVPNFLVLEFHAEDVDWYNDLAMGGAGRVERGRLALTHAPGFGIELDEAVARAHQKDPSEPLWVG